MPIIYQEVNFYIGYYMKSIVLKITIFLFFIGLSSCLPENKFKELHRTKSVEQPEDTGESNVDAEAEVTKNSSSSASGQTDEDSKNGRVEVQPNDLYEEIYEEIASSPVPVSGINLVFTLDDPMSYKNTHGYIVNYNKSLISEVDNTGNTANSRHIIKDINPGIHDIIITSTSKNLDINNSKAPDRGIRFNSINFTENSTIILKDIAIPYMGGIKGKVSLGCQNRSDGIEISIDGANIPSIQSNIDGHYALDQVPVGVHTLTFSKSEYLSKTVAAVTVEEDTILTLQDIDLSYAVPSFKATEPGKILEPIIGPPKDGDHLLLTDANKDYHGHCLKGNVLRDLKIFNKKNHKVYLSEECTAKDQLVAKKIGSDRYRFTTQDDKNCLQTWKDYFVIAPCNKGAPYAMEFELADNCSQENIDAYGLYLPNYTSSKKCMIWREYKGKWYATLSKCETLKTPIWFHTIK